MKTVDQIISEILRISMECPEFVAAINITHFSQTKSTAVFAFAGGFKPGKSADFDKRVDWANPALAQAVLTELRCWLRDERGWVPSDEAASPAPAVIIQQAPALPPAYSMTLADATEDALKATKQKLRDLKNGISEERRFEAAKAFAVKLAGRGDHLSPAVICGNAVRHANELMLAMDRLPLVHATEAAKVP